MTMFAPLRSRAFAGLWFSYAISVMATALVPTVVTLMILDGPGGVAALGIVLAARTTGFIVGAVAGGSLADRWPRSKVLASASLLRGTATLAIALAPGHAVAVMAGGLLLAGSGEGIFRSAYQAAVADVVGPDFRQGANALTTLAMRISLTVGPLLAVSLHAIAGPRPSLLLAATLWLLSATVIAVLHGALGRANTALAERPRNVARDYREGIVEALRYRWFVAGLAALSVWLGIGNSIQQLTLPLVSRAYLGGDAFIGYALGAYSLGALAGGVLLGSLRLARPGVWAFCGLSLYGLVPLALYSQSRPFILASYLLAGLGIEFFNIPWFTAIQNNVPRDMLGRISSIDFLVSYGISPLSLALLPAVLQSTGTDGALLMAGSIVLVVPLLALLTPGAMDLRSRTAVSQGTDAA